jgi:DNA-binding MltR family transcriptional regulator
MKSKEVKLVDVPAVDINVDLPPEEKAAFYDQSSDRAVGIMWAAILENHLTGFLRLIMLRDQEGKKVADDLFKSSGPLGPFGTKIRLAYLMRILDHSTYKDYLYINWIRNAFAHDLSKTSFDDQQISAWIKNMHIYGLVKNMGDAAKKRLAENQYPIDPEAHILRPASERTLSPKGRDWIAAQFSDSIRIAYRQSVEFMIQRMVYAEKQILATEKLLNEEEQRKKQPPESSPQIQ